jgi:hypothetical protein
MRKIEVTKNWQGYPIEMTVKMGFGEPQFTEGSIFLLLRGNN